MTRRRTFDAGAVPALFWQRDDVRLALDRREIGRLLGVYLATFPECTQTQLAILTQHDRSDISNFVRGTRSSRVTDIDVLARIAEGLAMPDAARGLLGLAPVGHETVVTTRTGQADPAAGPASVPGWHRTSGNGRSCRIAICGSRSPGCDGTAIDDAIHHLSRLVMSRQCQVDHAPWALVSK
jgi:hypothetical protein